MVDNEGTAVDNINPNVPNQFYLLNTPDYVLTKTIKINRKIPESVNKNQVAKKGTYFVHPMPKFLQFVESEEKEDSIQDPIENAALQITPQCSSTIWTHQVVTYMLLQHGCFSTIFTLSFIY